MSGTSGRVVTLIDMDCFYCQVEARLNPVHQGKPLAVVQYNLWRGGGIIAVNYEARDQGVTRGMRGDQAKQMCPDIVLVSVASVRGKADLSKYRDAGKEVVDVFKEYCDCVERASIDEAYLDLTQAVEQRVKKLLDSSTLITTNQLNSTFIVGFCPDKSNAEDTRISGLTEFLEDQKFNPETLRLAAAAALVEELRVEVLKRTGFHCSAGIAHNKVLAKLVCGIHKPRRQTVLPASCVEQLFSALPVRKVRNLGGKFGVKVVEELGCETMGDLSKFTKEELQQRFDEKTGLWLYEIARGIDSDPVTPRLIPKSIGCSKNFPGKNSLRKKEDVEHWMKELCGEVADRLSQDLQENKRRAQLLTVTISLDGQSCSRSSALPSYDAAKIAAEALSLISRSNNAPANSSAWQPAITMISASASKFVSDEGHRSSGIQSFFKQVPKSSKDETQKDKSNSAPKQASVKVDIAPKESAGTLKGSTDSKPAPKPGNIGSFFKSQSQKIPAEIKSEENRKRAESEDKAPENSFFLSYLQSLKAPARDSTPAKVESVTLSSSAGSTVSDNTSKLDESINLIREMFPDPCDVDESVISLLSTSMQEKFYEWQTKYRRELGLASPEKAQRETVSPEKAQRKPVSPEKAEGKTVPKAPFEVSPWKKPTENPKPKGSIDTFFQKPQQENSEQSSLESHQPGCSYQYISEDSNSCDTFNLAESSYDEMEQCSICHEMILLREFPEHVDYHAAVSLDKKLNKVEPLPKAPVQPSKSVVQPSKASAVIPVKKRGRPSKNESIRPQNGKKLKSISSFFSVREST